MAANRVLDRMRARIERVCSSSLDERSLRAAVLAEVRAGVGFEAHVWLLTDPATTVGCAPLADVPCLPQLPMLIRLKYLTTVNRWSDLLRGPVPVGLLHRDTGGDLSRSLVWRKLLRDFDISDIASVVFADKHGCWGFLDLWRHGATFTNSEAALLTDIAPPICAALRRRQAEAFALPRIEPPGDGPAVLILGDDLLITGRTTAATQWLRSLLPTSAEQDPIPAAAYNVAAQLLAIEAGVDDNPASARAYVPGRTWVTLRASRLESRDDSGNGAIAVSIEETTAGARLDLFASSFGLSVRERQVLDLLGRGADTREVASDMVIAEYTVQDHLKSIFAKTGLTSRSTLVAAAIGPRRDPEPDR